MSQIEFYQTMMGRKFYEGHVPSLVDSLNRIADSLEKLSNPLVKMNTAGVKSGRFSSTESHAPETNADAEDVVFKLNKEVMDRLLLPAQHYRFNEGLTNRVHADAEQDAELTNGSGPYAQIMKILQVNGAEEGTKMVWEILEGALKP